MRTARNIPAPANWRVAGILSNSTSRAGPSRGDGVAKVALHRVQQKRAVLDQNGPVQAEVLPKLLVVGGGRLGRQQQQSGITRQVHAHEDDQAEAKQGDQPLEYPWPVCNAACASLIGGYVQSCAGIASGSRADAHRTSSIMSTVLVAPKGWPPVVGQGCANTHPGSSQVSDSIEIAACNVGGPAI